MVVEGVNGLIVVIVDVYLLECVDDKILCFLGDGWLGMVEMFYFGLIVLDGNLILDLLCCIVKLLLFVVVDLWVVFVSFGKVDWLLMLLGYFLVMFYVNLEEVNLFCYIKFEIVVEGVVVLIECGVKCVFVINGGKEVVEVIGDDIIV